MALSGAAQECLWLKHLKKELECSSNGPTLINWPVSFELLETFDNLSCNGLAFDNSDM